MNFLLIALLAATPVQKLLTKLSQRTEGPEVLELEIGSDDPERRFVTPEERALLQKNRKEVVRLEGEQLRTKCDLTAAMVLGELDDKSALAQLQRCFVEDTYTYGWETDTPNPLDALQHPHHYAFEDAISALTAKHLEDVLVLDEKTVDKLLKRKDDAARYVLYRLRPDALLQKVATEFQKSKSGSYDRFLLALQASYLVSKLTRAEITRLFGPAEFEEPTRFSWKVQNLHEEPVKFVIEFDDFGQVKRAAIE